MCILFCVFQIYIYILFGCFLRIALFAGPFYVMMSPQDVLQTSQRALAPRTHQYSPKLEGGRTARDERRRATHNEGIDVILLLAVSNSQYSNKLNWYMT